MAPKAPVFLAVCLSMCALLVGFCLFLLRLPQVEKPFSYVKTADAIVVLTGGEERLAAGLQLLQNGRAPRLFISGVRSGTKVDDFIKLYPQAKEWLLCCVVRDEKARNTIENAREIARWAQQYHYDHLILVTAHYHIERAQGELRHVWPDGTIDVYTVRPSLFEKTDLASRWQSFKLLVHEYLKLLGSRLRHAFV